MLGGPVALHEGRRTIDVLVGSSVHTFGEDYKSAVNHVDATLTDAREMDLDRDADAGFIWAVTPAHQTEDFVTARIFLKQITRAVHLVVMVQQCWILLRSSK